MEEFGPGNTNHGRVPWPDKWQLEPSVLLPSWITQNITHNFPLSNENRARVDQFRASIALQISEGEEASKHVQREDIERLKKELFACDVVLSPARTLPYDVLHHVTSFCPLIYPPSGIYTHPKSHFPSVVAQVSRSWRDAVEGNHRAWQKMRFNCKLWNGIPADLVFKRIERFSRLSGTLPISLQVDEIEPNYDDAYPYGLGTISDWVWSEWKDRQRLKVLTVFSASPYFLLKKMEGLEEDIRVEPGTQDFPANIESLRLLKWVGGMRAWLGPLNLTRVLKVWQSLRHLWVGGMMDDADFDKLTLSSNNPWRRLKSLYLGEAVRHELWLAVIMNCPELEALWMYHTGDQGFGAPPPTIPPGGFAHLHLKELHLGLWHFTDCILRCFVNLKFPVLNSLHLHFVHSNPSTESALQPNDLAGVFPALKHLYIHETGSFDHWNPLAGVFPLVIAVPTVTSLSTSFSIARTLEFLSFFGGLRENILPLPNLHTYNLHFTAEPANGSGHDTSNRMELLHKQLIKSILTAVRKKRPAVLPPSTSTVPTTSPKEVHPGLTELTIWHRIYNTADYIVDNGVSPEMATTEMFQYLTHLRETFVEGGVDIKFNLDSVQDGEALMFHEGWAEREFMKRFDLY